MPYIPPRPPASASSASPIDDLQPTTTAPAPTTPEQPTASSSSSRPAPPDPSAAPRLRVTEPEGDLTPRPVDMPPPPSPPPLHSLPSTLAAMSIHTDPPTTAAQVRQLDGEIGADMFSPASQPLEAAPPQKPKQSQSGSQDDVPGLSAGSTTSASSTSIESLDSYGDGGVSPPSSGTGTGTGTGDDGKSTPATSVGVVEIDDREDNVRRYKRELYLYTRGLYLEAKLSSSRSDKRRGSTGGAAYTQFGQKQSGMERLAQKKALARRLNG